MNISLIQAHLTWEDKPANYKHIETLIDNISEPTDLIILPEMFNTGFSMKPEEFAEPMKGESMQYLQKWAQQKNAAIITSFIVEEAGKYFNRMFFVFPDGHFEHYNKRHLFRMGGEHKSYTMGDKQTIVEYKGYRIMLQVCYDLRFPVWARNHNHYDLLVYVANWPASRRSAWETLLKARAIENQTYVVGVNRVGEDGNGHEHSGDSALIDFKGNAISQFTPHKEQVLTYKIDKQKQDEFREAFPAYLDADQFKIL